MEFKREDCADKVERVRKGREAGLLFEEERRKLSTLAQGWIR